MVRTISTPRKIPPIIAIDKCLNQKQRTSSKTSRIIGDDTIAKVVPPQADDDVQDDVQIFYEKLSDRPRCQQNNGTMTKEQMDFIRSVCQCHKVNVTSDIEEFGLAVNHDNLSADEDEESQETEDDGTDDGTAARTRHAILLKDRDDGTAARTRVASFKGLPSLAIHGVMPQPGPLILQNQNALNDDGIENTNDTEEIALDSALIEKPPVVVTGDNKGIKKKLDSSKSGATKFALKKKLDSGKTKFGLKKKKKISKIPKCYFCQKTTKTKQALERHLRTHTKEAPFVCNFCRKEFTLKQTLKVHIRRHLKEKPYKCSHPGCLLSFVSGNELKNHIRIHSEEKPFTCSHPDCGKSFKRKSHLLRHFRIHSGEKPFGCSFPGCGKKFNDQGHVTRHMRTHD